MGGYGSGRWHWHTRKTTVEECRWIDVARWVREGIIRPTAWISGSWLWMDAVTGEKTSSISYEVNTGDSARSWVRLYYTITQTGFEVDYKILLQTTRPNFGGVRWWFTCPLVVNDRHCGRRARKLYLPPGGRYFGCRHCYDLTYKSCQESDKRVSALRRAFDRDPFAILNAAIEDEVDLIMALKATSGMAGRWW